MGEVLEGELLQRVLELKKVKNLRRDGKADEARKEVLKYVEKYPDDYYGLFTAGRILSKTDPEKAKEYLLKVANSDSPNRFSAYTTLGEISEKQRNKEQAIKYYKTAILDNPHVETYAIVSLANILISDKRYDEAFKLISLIKDSSPDYYNAAIAEIYVSKKQYQQAKEYIDKVKTTGLNYFDRKIYLKKANINKIMKNYDVAFYYLDKLANKKDTYYERSLIEKADIYFELKNYEKAYQICQKCDQNNFKVNYLLGRLNEIFGNVEEAKKNYLIANNSNSNSIVRDTSSHLGDILCEEKELSKALDYYKLSISKSVVFSPTIYFRVISILIKQESYEEAYEYLLKMKELYANIDCNPLYKLTKTYLSKILSKEISMNDLSFKELMIISYSYSKVIKHIKEYESESRAKFCSYDDIENIFAYAQNNLVPENKIETRILDTYDIYINDVGYKNDKFTSKLRVVAIPHTSLILDMYPTFDETLKDKINKSSYQFQKK